MCRLNYFGFVLWGVHLIVGSEYHASDLDSPFRNKIGIYFTVVVYFYNDSLLVLSIPNIPNIPPPMLSDFGNSSPSVASSRP